MQGTPFGRYLLIELLGRGGMGEVWRAHDTVTNRTVAVKLLPQHLSHDPDYQRRFRKEAYAAARLANPHLIPIHTYGDVAGRLFLDMRLIEGRNLEDVIDDGPIELSRAVNIIEQIADALQAAHTIGLVHRDVKPSNVLLAENDFAYLIDFGIAKGIGETRITGTGNMIGSYHYMAPERLSGNDAGTRSDVYSLACVLFECLTGDRPFPGDSLESQVGGHMMTEPPRPSATHAAVPAAFDAVIATGMAKVPAERYSTPMALAQAARAAVETSAASAPRQRDNGPAHSSPTSLASLPVFAPTDVRPVPISPTTGSRDRGSGRKRALIVGATTVLVVAGITAGYVVMQQRGDSSVKEEPTGAAVDAFVGLVDRIKIGDCLDWPARRPDQAEIVDCTRDHRFEVAEVPDLSTFPGGEYGPDAAPPSAVRIQQISQEQCAGAVKRYLGTRFDPNSRFTTSILWSGDQVWRQSGERRMLCGLQLSGPNNEQSVFRGKVADVDQSKVWPVGTCISIDPSTNQPTDIPVDCAAPHAMEVTGSVNVGEQFPDVFPSEAEQDAFIKEQCTTITDSFLAPKPLRDTTLTLIYSTLSSASWAAGSRQVACYVGATLGNGGWATLLNSAKGSLLLINGEPPSPP